MSYSIMEKGMIISKHSAAHTMIISKILFANRSRMFTFVIKATKLNHVQIKMTFNSTDSHIIYDGPGLLSSIVIGNNNVYNCSYFQCTLHMFLKLHPEGRQVRYTSWTLPIASGTVIVKGQNQITQNTCIKSPCVLVYKKYMRYDINATVTQMTIQGFRTHQVECTYGGLLGIEGNKGIFKESLSVCENIDHTVHHSRSFYSSNSTLILILYWYQPYSNITLTLEVSKTECKTTYINYKLIHALCHQQHQLEKIPEECSSYLKHKGLFYGEKFAFASLGDAIQFPLSLNNCLVFQFHYSNTDISSDNDEVKIKLSPASMTIQSQVQMILKGRLNHIEWIRVTDLEQSSEYRYLSEAPQKLHCIHNDQISGGYLPKQSFEEIGNQGENTFLMLKIKTPNAPYQFPINVQFFSHTYSWLDIIVKRTEKVNSSIYPREIIPFLQQSGTYELQRVFTEQLYVLFLTVKTNDYDTALHLMIDTYENPNFWTDSYCKVDIKLLEYENVLGVSLGAKISNVEITVNRSISDFYEKLVVTAIWVRDLFNDLHFLFG